MLKLKRVAIDTYKENVAFLSRDCRAYPAEDFKVLSRVEIRSEKGQILAILNIVDDPSIVGCAELGLSRQAFDLLGAEEGADVTLAHATPPSSLDAIRSKIHGHSLTDAQLEAIIRDIVANRYSKIEIAAFLISCASFMTTREILGLTRAMTKTGTRLQWHDGTIVDKHCIGGIPANRTTMVIVPIVAAHGLSIPKTSSRAITSPSGTADTMEVLARVDISAEAMQKMVRDHHGCIVWGGHVNLSPADDVLISVERPLGIDTKGQMVASILSKKVAAGAERLLIDIPIGPTAKVRRHEEAVELRKLFEYIGDQMGLPLEVMLTDGSQPVGRGIGPVLEARDVMQVLECDPAAPQDLREKSLQIAGRLIEFDENVRGGSGYEIAKEILDSGKALKKMQDIIEAQGAPPEKYTPGKLTREIVALVSGRVQSIDCYRIAQIARLAGAPLSKGAGIDLLTKVGDWVEAGDRLYRIHAETDSGFRFASVMAENNPGYHIEPTEPR